MPVKNNWRRWQILTAERLREVVSYDSDTGFFTWATNRKKCSKGKTIGTLKSNGYLHACIDGKKYLLHRLAWMYVHGEFPAADVDHIDGNRTNNALINLRSVSRSTNLENMHTAKSHNKSTGLLGAYKHKDRFTSRIQVNGRTIHLGMFDTKEDAHAAYVSAKRAMHKGNTI